MDPNENFDLQENGGTEHFPVADNASECVSWRMGVDSTAPERGKTQTSSDCTMAQDGAVGKECANLESQGGDLLDIDRFQAEIRIHHTGAVGQPLADWMRDDRQLHPRKHSARQHE